MSDEQFGPKPHPAYCLGDIVELRDGTVAIFSYYDAGSSYPCKGHAIGKRDTYAWTLEGRFHLAGIESDWDIVKKIGNVWHAILAHKTFTENQGRSNIPTGGNSVAIVLTVRITNHE